MIQTNRKLALLIFLAVLPCGAQTQTGLNCDTSANNQDYQSNPIASMDEYDGTGCGVGPKCGITLWLVGGGNKTAFKSMCPGTLPNTYQVCTQATEWTAAGRNVYSLQYATGLSWQLNASINNSQGTLVVSGPGNPSTNIPFIPPFPFQLMIDGGTGTQEIVTAISINSPFGANMTLNVTRGSPAYAHTGPSVMNSPSWTYTQILNSVGACLAYMGVQGAAGTLHGNPNDIVIFDHSAGSYPPMMFSRQAKGTYITGTGCQWCANANALNWTIRAAVIYAIESDLNYIYNHGLGQAVNGTDTILGCVPAPGFTSCINEATAASPITYAANPSLFPLFGGYSITDNTLPPIQQLAWYQATGGPFAALSSNAAASTTPHNWPDHTLDIDNSQCQSYPCSAAQMGQTCTGGYCDTNVVAPAGALGIAEHYFEAFIAPGKSGSSGGSGAAGGS